MLLYLLFASPSCRISRSRSLSSVDVSPSRVARQPLSKRDRAVGASSAVLLNVRCIDAVVGCTCTYLAVLASVRCNRDLFHHCRTKPSPATLPLRIDAIDTRFTDAVTHFRRLPVRWRFKVLCLHWHLWIEELPCLHHYNFNSDGTCLLRR